MLFLYFCGLWGMASGGTIHPTLWRLLLLPFWCRWKLFLTSFLLLHSHNLHLLNFVSNRSRLDCGWRVFRLIPFTNIQELVLLISLVSLLNATIITISFQLFISPKISFSLQFVYSAGIIDGYFLRTSAHGFLHASIEGNELWGALHRFLHRVFLGPVFHLFL